MLVFPAADIKPNGTNFMLQNLICRESNIWIWEGIQSKIELLTYTNEKQISEKFKNLLSKI